MVTGTTRVILYTASPHVISQRRKAEWPRLLYDLAELTHASLMKPIILSCCIVFLLSGSLTSLAQNVSVRVIDVHTGKPMRDLEIIVGFIDSRLQNPASTLQLTTGKSGEAVFVVTPPAPEMISVQARLPGNWHCGCQILTSTTDLLTHGVNGTKPAHAASDDGSFSIRSPGAGTITLFARPYTFLEKLMSPFLRE